VIHNMACRRGAGPVLRAALAGELEGVTAGKPWWQATRTARWGFILGAFWAVLGLVSLPYAIRRGGPLEWAVTATWLLCALGYLMTAVALRRRERSGPGPNS